MHVLVAIHTRATPVDDTPSLLLVLHDMKSLRQIEDIIKVHTSMLFVTL